MFLSQTDDGGDVDCRCNPLQLQPDYQDQHHDGLLEFVELKSLLMGKLQTVLYVCIRENM